MADGTIPAGYKLPVNPERQQGTVAQGFVTPKQDRTPQIQSIPARRVLPIIFIPGIMGSNLRISAQRQTELGQKHNIAWRPDHLSVTVPQYDDTPTERQRRLDPRATELDIYDPISDPTGAPSEEADQRNSEVKITLHYPSWGKLDGPLLRADPPGTKNAKSENQKARERGWGEVYFSSYYEILAACESNLNAAFSNKRLNIYLKKFVAGIAPSKWEAHAAPLLSELDVQTMRDTVKGCWFPAHAMGYNWLKGNGESGARIAERIKALMKRYQDQGYQCEKVILVTHSMGGLVARAVIHPDMGNLSDKVLGIVHGVMPATGAGAAYKRMRCGFEGVGVGARILGHVGPNVTAVLGNAQGGLELLPSQAYGNDWLRIQHRDKTLKSLPQKGDPYEEIYKVRDKWFGLLREEWINPAEVQGSGFEKTCAMLDKAKTFHKKIASTYHDQSYAHYGADSKRAAWHRVVWEIEKDASVQNVDMLAIVADDAEGEMKMTDPSVKVSAKGATRPFVVRMLDAADPGDETVPLHSADAQLSSGKFKGIFRQTGYEHQASYSNPAVIAATLYSLFRIASTMKWSKS